MYVSREGDHIKYGLQENDSQQLRDIIGDLVPDWALLFARKNADYGSHEQSAGVLGIRGQYADIWRKMSKLKRSMWDGEELKFEKTEEVISDLIGHLFLTLHMMRVKDEAEREYAFTSDEEAVNSFMRMVGGDALKARALSYNLAQPFGDLVRDRVNEIIKADSDKFLHHTVAKAPQEPELDMQDVTERINERLRDANLLSTDGVPRLATQGMLAGRRITSEMLNREGADLFLEHKLGSQPGERFRLQSPYYAALASEEFAKADQEQTLGDEPDLDPACGCHDNEGNSLLPAPEGSDLEELVEYFDGLSTTPEQQAEMKVILDKLFKNSDKQRELLSKFERKIRGY